MSRNLCTIEGCQNARLARRWCSRHYTAWRRHGDPEHSGERHYASPEEAFKARTERRDGCLIWNGAVTRLGYGQIAVEGKVKLAHRYAWERAEGVIPEGMEVDHACHDRACVDIDHLRLAARFENMRNLSGPTARNKVGVRNVRKVGRGFRAVVNRDELGTFKTLEEARLAAELGREVHFGEFAGSG